MGGLLSAYQNWTVGGGGGGGGHSFGGSKFSMTVLKIVSVLEVKRVVATAIVVILATDIYPILLRCCPSSWRQLQAPVSRQWGSSQMDQIFGL